MSGNMSTENLVTSLPLTRGPNNHQPRLALARIGTSFHVSVQLLVPHLASVEDIALPPLPTPFRLFSQDLDSALILLYPQYL